MTIIVIVLLCWLILVCVRLYQAQQRHQQLTRTIQNIQKNNKQANSNKATFLATASHDLQQPHQALGLFLAAIDSTSLSPENNRIINKAKDAHETTSRLLNQLLDISRLDSSEKPCLQTVPLHDFIHQVGMKFMPVCAAHGIELRIRQREAYANTDPILLERMLTNFLLNAIRHAKPSSILLSIRHRHIGGDAHWCLEVYDNGKGIAPDKQELVFQEFIQLNKPDNAHKGLGLGLAIVQRLSSLLQHPIALRSKLGKGSCFAIQLRASSQQPLATTLHTADESVVRQRLKVAIIVHNDLIRESLSLLISSWGCTAESFPSSFQMLRHIREHAWQPDALIIDGTLQSTCLNLSDIQGIRQSTQRDMTMIMITQQHNSTYAKEVQALGFALLSDPINPLLLKALLSDVPS